MDMIRPCVTAALAGLIGFAVAADEARPSNAGHPKDMSGTLREILGAIGCHVPVSGLRVCTPKMAAALVATGADIMLPDLTEPTPDTAHELSRCTATLTLGMTSLTPGIAAILAKCPGNLELPRIETISVASVEAFSKREGGLSFNGLRTLEPDLAAALARCPANPLRLDGVPSLSPESATALANYKASMLSLGGLREIDLPTARALATRRGHWLLFLDGLSRLTPEVASVLASHPGHLYLGGLKTLPADVAIALAACERVGLYGLTRIEVDTADALGRGGASLSLKNLETLTPEVARGLAGCRCVRMVSPPTTVSPEVAESLAGVDGCEFVLPFLESLTLENAKRIAQREIEISLPAIRSLVSDEATEIARTLAMKPGTLALPNLTRITRPAIEALGAKPDLQLKIDAIEIVNDPANGASDDVIVPKRLQQRNR